MAYQVFTFYSCSVLEAGQTGHNMLEKRHLKAQEPPNNSANTAPAVGSCFEVGLFILTLFKVVLCKLPRDSL